MRVLDLLPSESQPLKALSRLGLISVSREGVA
jgi:hypothetical protein